MLNLILFCSCRVYT